MAATGGTDMLRYLIAWAGCVALAMPGEAQTPPPPPAIASARVSVPFNPAVGLPLRYRVTATKMRGGRPVTVWINYELSFTRRPEGFRLAVRATDAGSPGVTGPPAAIVRRTILGVSLPYALLLDEQGAVEAMENEENYWNRMLALTEQAVRQNVGSGRPLDEAALGQMMRMMRETPPAARLATATENIAPILQFGGGEFVLGETRTGEEEVAGLMGMTVRQRSQLRAERIENGSLRLVLRSTVPPEDVRRAIEGFVARIPVTGQGQNNQSERERGLAELRAARFDRQSEYVFEVALDSGLVHSGGGQDRTLLEMRGERHDQTESYRVERLD